MHNIKTEEFFSESKVIIEKLKNYSELSYLMNPILDELQAAYKQKCRQHISWRDASVEEVAQLIDDLDSKAGMTLESEIMKRATYLVEFGLWIKVMELLIHA